MLKRYKRRIYKLTRLLRELEQRQDDYALLARLQRALVASILGTERDLVVLRDQLAAIKQHRGRERPARELSIQLKALADEIKEAIGDLKRMSYYWRCFGDGIAFIYIDKYALKHMYYKVEDYSPKESAGQLSDKDGFAFEWQVLRTLLRKGFPAVLCDLTNTLRHGDVCVLVGPDPYPIEVKSSKNRNARVDRQIENNKALLSFYQTDEAKNFRGVKNVQRMELPVADPEHYRDAINDCMRKSIETGYASVSPDTGLVYACLRTEDANLLTIDMQPRMITCVLNEAKTECSWAPYYPFTLTIRHEDDLYDFVIGKAVLIVGISTDSFVQVFKEHGLDATFVEHPMFVVKINRLDADSTESATAIIPIPTFGRHFYDFESIQGAAKREAWFMQHMEENGGLISAALKAGEMSPDDLDIVQLPLELKALRVPGD